MAGRSAVRHGTALRRDRSTRVRRGLDRRVGCGQGRQAVHPSLAARPCPPSTGSPGLTRLPCRAASSTTGGIISSPVSCVVLAEHDRAGHVQEQQHRLQVDRIDGSYRAVWLGHRSPHARLELVRVSLRSGAKVLCCEGDGLPPPHTAVGRGAVLGAGSHARPEHRVHKQACDLETLACTDHNR